MKTASLVHFYFGEQSYVNRLAQETVPLDLALRGYDRSVLLHHSTSLGPLRVSDADERNATVVDTPTAANLIRHLNDLGDQGYTVDLYVFAHGWPGEFLVSQGTYGDNAMLRARVLERDVRPLNLRAVWQCNCYGASMNPTWMKLGAKVAAGSRFVNFYPNRFRNFVTAWAEGKTFGKAVIGSDTAAVRTPVQAYILADALGRLGEWDGNVLSAPTVLGSNESAVRYFRECWLGDNVDPTKSGKQNMNVSSAMVISGDRTQRR